MAEFEASYRRSSRTTRACPPCPTTCSCSEGGSGSGSSGNGGSEGIAIVGGLVFWAAVAYGLYRLFF